MKNKYSKDIIKEQLKEEELTKAGANLKYRDMVERLFQKRHGGPVVRFAYAFESNFSNIKKPIEVLNPEKGIALNVYFVDDSKLYVVTVYELVEGEIKNKMDINYYSIRNIKNVLITINQYTLDYDELNFAKVTFIDGTHFEINVPDTPINIDQGQDMYRRRALAKFVKDLNKKMY
ncbi:hypothetical protein [Fictibacillus sp. 26RED30]|uniref:hypothetical protein n=1 Tax=Fictibacillus sp. 26RED30 TaxID=2745877 RepID=UPI0018CD474C|nr:hypothetical protein [Fictibacillus sp. 26RED30]MBH0159861.1 hypothetical protein [Fictibacillus sp. 26RED30]